MRLAIYLDNWPELLDQVVGPGTAELAAKVPGGAGTLSAQALVLNGLKDKIAPQLAAAGAQARLVVEASDAGDPVHVVGPIPAAIVGLLGGFGLAKLFEGD